MTRYRKSGAVFALKEKFAISAVLFAFPGFLALGLFVACAQTKSDQARPRRVGSQSSNTIRVKAGDNLQAALNQAQYGDTIILDAGAKYKTSGRPFTLPAKPGSGMITIQTSNLDSLPAGRVSLADRGKMPQIVATGSAGALTAARGAHGWTFVGIEFTNQSDGSQAQHCNTLLDFGAGTPEESGNNLLFDRVLVHPQEDGTTNYYRTATRGFFANAGEITIKNSYVGGFGGFYANDRNEVIDSEAFASVVGGPYKIENSFLQAQFNPIFLGGGDPGVPKNHVGTILAGATLTQATLSKTTDLQVGDKIALQVGAAGGDEFACGTVTAINGSTVTYTALVRNEGGERYVTSSRTPQPGGQARWRGYTIRNVTVTKSTISIDREMANFVLSKSGAKPKAYAEIKLLEDSLWEGNTFEGFPTGIAITLRNQNGFSPWSNVKNVIFKSNLFKEFSTGAIVQLFSGDRLSETGSNIQFVNNLFYGPISNSLVGTFPNVAYTSFGQGTPLLLSHNTFINRQDISGGPMIIGLAPMSGAIVKDNIMYFNRYGTQCALPGNAFNSCWPNFTEANNVIINNDNECDYITGKNGNFRKSFCAANERAVKFSDPANNDYRLRPDSPYRNAASDGTDIGVNMNALNAALGVQND